jgi:hypothetical protein
VDGLVQRRRRLEQGAEEEGEEEGEEEAALAAFLHTEEAALLALIRSALDPSFDPSSGHAEGEGDEQDDEPDHLFFPPADGKRSQGSGHEAGRDGPSDWQTVLSDAEFNPTYGHSATVVSDALGVPWADPAEFPGLAPDPDPSERRAQRKEEKRRHGGPFGEAEPSAADPADPAVAPVPGWATYDTRVVVFGGFRGGGYRAPSSALRVLTRVTHVSLADPDPTADPPETVDSDFIAGGSAAAAARPETAPTPTLTAPSLAVSVSLRRRRVPSLSHKATRAGDGSVGLDCASVGCENPDKRRADVSASSRAELSRGGRAGGGNKSNV